MRFGIVPFLVLVGNLTVSAQTIAKPASELWQASNPGFRAIGITSTPSAFWVCGPGESIASSIDGTQWTMKHHLDRGGALLLGIGFSSDKFGYAYGTGGTILTTEDGGATWVHHKVGDDTIIAASLSDSSHGLVRTKPILSYLDGSDVPHPISEPAEILKRYPYTPSLAALTPEKMGVVVSAGQYAATGLLTTTDGGKAWTFYGPPSTQIKSFLSVGEKYWTSGHEVIGKDKPGGGYGVPMAMTSDDGLHWQHTDHDIKACHWEICGLCTSAGCLASGTLLMNFFGGDTTYASIPKGNLTAKWAATKDSICTIHDGVSCAKLLTASDVQAQPEIPQPFEQSLPPLGTKASTGTGLQCISCAIEPAYVDEKNSGRFPLQVSLLIRSDGTIETVTIEKAPSDSLQRKIEGQISEWLFEPPTKDGQPIRVSTKLNLNINVVRSR
jgi:photosystem II stability/assembly factor-like uncharacterized protein